MSDKQLKSHLLGLPSSRVKVIMKSSPDVASITPDALYAMTKATVSMAEKLFVSCRCDSELLALYNPVPNYDHKMLFLKTYQIKSF